MKINRPRSTRRRAGVLADALVLAAISATWCLFTGDDYTEQTAFLIVCVLFVRQRALDDKMDELLGDLPAKVLECPYGHGECEPRPAGIKPCGHEGPEVTQPLSKVSERDSGRN